MEASEIAASLTPRPALALKNWPGDATLTWMEVVALAAFPGDRQLMGYTSVLRPLESRGLAVERSPVTYDDDTGQFTHRRYGLTFLGEDVRSHLLKERAMNEPALDRPDRP